MHTVKRVYDVWRTNPKFKEHEHCPAITANFICSLHDTCKTSINPTIPQNTVYSYLQLGVDGVMYMARGINFYSQSAISLIRIADITITDITNWN